jgi:sarcosine oxidase
MPPAPHFDTIVLGHGTMGAAAIHALLSTDPTQRVLTLDRHAPPHHQGSHHGQVRMFRLSYYEHPAYVPWLRHSLDAWQQMGSAYGQPLIHLTGALYMGRPDSDLISGSLRAIRAHHLPHEQLTRKDLRARYPQFQLPPDYVGLLDHQAGYIHCERAITAMLALGAPGAPGLRGGSAPAPLTLRANEPALSWSSNNHTVEVHTATQIYTANNLIITAGPWAASLLRDLNVQLTVTRQVQGWLTPTDPAPFAPPHFPCWAIDPGDGSLFYGFPALTNDANPSAPPQIKLARHAKGSPTTADTVTRSPLPHDAEDFMPLVRQYLPTLAHAAIRTSVCLYTNSPDSHYLIDRHPHHPNVALAAGFSGHGFKAAPAVGHILRELITRPAAPHLEPFFSLKRLAN